MATTADKKPKRYDIAIVGGGASGTILLLHLLETIRHPFSVALIQKGHAIAKGVAYSTTDPSHLLNVRAGRMSAYAAAPTHFCEWLQSQPEYPAVLGPDKESEAFVPRYLYGKYLQESLQNALNRKKEDFTIDFIPAFATSVGQQEGYILNTDDGRKIAADRICIATGIEAPHTLPGLKEPILDPRIHINPWLEKFPELESSGDILIIGTGLTMIDNVLSILGTGFKGKIIALSKHGHLPMPHPSVKPGVKPDPSLKLPHDLSTLFSFIKKRIQSHPDPEGWEEPVLEDIRSYSQQLWFNFSPAEKHRFLRHLQHHWSKLRHRIPYPVYQKLKEAIDKGQLVLHGGSIEQLQQEAATLSVIICDRRKNKFNYNVQRIFNCVGPVLNVEQSTNPFLKSLAQQGFIRNCASDLGPDATMQGKVIGTDGHINEQIFVVGPLMRGVVWEAVAVPEIRNAAQVIANEISEKLHQRQEVA